MIVTLTFPNNITQVRYGHAGMLVEGHQLDIPAYVAKTLLTLSGVTGPALSQTALQLLGDTEDGSEFEANYIFLAYGQSLSPVATRVVDAVALMTENGEPAVSMS